MHPFQSPIPNLQLRQSIQPTYLREAFTIQPTRRTLSASFLTLSRPLITSHLMFSNQTISITADCTSYHLNSAPFLYLTAIIANHKTSYYLAPLSITPQAFHSKLKCHLFKNSFPNSSDNPSSLPKRRQLNSYSVPLTLWKSDLSSLWTTLWEIPLIRRSARE